MPTERILGAAAALFSDDGSSEGVSMDDIAAAAGVGKGTLFRAFGSRDGLLDALFVEKLTPLKVEIARGGSFFGTEVDPVERVVLLMAELLRFKRENPRLLASREVDASRLLDAPHYQWVHGLLTDLVTSAGVRAEAAVFTSHVLLGALRVEVLDALRADGQSDEGVAAHVASLARLLCSPGA